ncbi:MAG: MBL fold metallo-hydrolase [Candidatus Doudnabacteria bacterium]|nr:MBL fold metallo-hydrolase [Candidatus Doudnabacteria bacterium]
MRKTCQALETLDLSCYNTFMVITWYGLSCFKISSGSLTLITDPFLKSVGLTPPRMAADLAIVSNIKSEASNNVSSLGDKRLFVIDGPGEFDVKELFVHGVAAQGEGKNKNNGFDYTTIYAIRMEDINLGFLGSLKQRELSDIQLEALENIDILFVPVGGNTVCDAEEAITIVNQIEPRIVIPMHFAQKGLKLSLDKLEPFLKEIGSTKTASQEKLTIKKSNLADIAAATQVVVLKEAG